MTQFNDEPFLDSDFKSHSDLSLIKHRIQTLLKINYSSLSASQITEILFRYLECVPVKVAFIDPENFNDKIFYRTRLNIHESEDINLIRTYSYPPSSYCKENGRANLKGKSVFYCSNSAISTLVETKPKVGDTGSISFWKGNAENRLKCGIFFGSKLPDINPWQNVAIDFHAEQMKFIQQNPSLKNNISLEIFNFIEERFRNELQNYPITSAVSNEMLFGNRLKHFIVYPSVKDIGESCNYAFHPNVADLYLKFSKVIRFKILGIEEDKYQIGIGKVGELKNSTIEWRETNDDEKSFDRFQR